MLQHVYLNSFSLGSLIGIAFFLITALFLLMIPNKSKASFHFGMAFLMMVLFNGGYLISSTFYHPLAAYHRWLTVLTIFMVESHIIAFMFNFPDDRAPRVARAFLIACYVIGLITFFVFCAGTYHANKIYLFTAHYWDFDADAISKIVSYIIIFFIVIVMALDVWRIIIHRGKERLVMILLFPVICVATVLPAAANTLSRDGLIGREAFQNMWVMCNVLGFFGLLLLYINNARDRITFMGKLIGVSMVTILLMLQIISYFLLLE